MNKIQKADFGNIDIANILVQRLRSRGYKAEVTNTKKGLYISLSAIAPYGNEYMTGGGLFQRTFVGIKSNAVAHSNFIATLIDSDTKKMNSPSLGTVNGSYFQKKTSYNDNLKNWSSFPTAQKTSMKANLKKVLEDNSDKIIEALGL